MANLSRVVNTATKKVLGAEKIQATIESMQLDLANEGFDLVGKAIRPVWNQYLASLKRQNTANEKKVVLKGDYALIAEMFKKVAFTSMTMEEINQQIYLGHNKERDLANEEQLAIIRDHSKLEAKVIAGRLTVIRDFLASKGIEVSLSEDIQQGGKSAIGFFAAGVKDNAKNPYAFEKNELKTAEQHEKERKEQEKKRDLERKVLAS